MAHFKYTSDFHYDPTNIFGHMQEEFPKQSEFNVVIIGAGPNGLIAGAYLSQAGLSVAICERRFEAGGGLAAEVDQILLEQGRAVGVHITHEGRVLRAKAVMSTLDPHTTFLDLVGEAHLPPSLRDAVEGWAWEKWSFNTLHIAADDPPRYGSDDPWIDDAFTTVIGIESVDQLLVHWDNVS